MSTPAAPSALILSALARAAARDHEKGGDGWRTTREVADAAAMPVGRARRVLLGLEADGAAQHDQDTVHFWRWPSDRPLLRFLDFDARRAPKTGHFCIKCQRDLDPAKPFRTVRVLSDGSAMVVHPKGAQLAEGEAATWPIGDDCSYAFNIFWTHDPR